MADTTQPITLTERAARSIAYMVEQEGTPNGMLRVAVSGGGCSGFQYGFNLDHEVQEGDVVIERGQAQVVIDNLSLMSLAGAEVDFVTAIIGSYFTIKNPNATSSCGCGNSFAVS